MQKNSPRANGEQGMNAVPGLRTPVRAALLALAGILALGAVKPAEAAFGRRFVITVGAGQVTGGPHANFPMLVSFQHNNLRTTANGGLVTSDAGDDILLRGEDVTTCDALTAPFSDMVGAANEEETPNAQNHRFDTALLLHVPAARLRRRGLRYRSRR